MIARAASLVSCTNRKDGGSKEKRETQRKEGIKTVRASRQCFVCVLRGRRPQKSRKDQQRRRASASTNVRNKNCHRKRNQQGKKNNLKKEHLLE